MKYVLTALATLAIAAPGSALATGSIGIDPIDTDPVCNSGEHCTWQVLDADGLDTHTVQGTFIGEVEAGFGEPRSIAPAVQLVRDSDSQTVNIKMSRIRYVAPS